MRIIQNYFARNKVVAGEWNRVSATFTATGSNATVSFTALGASGNTWFDCVQLEEGEVAKRYNIIKNGNLMRVSGSNDIGRMIASETPTMSISELAAYLSTYEWFYYLLDD